MKIINATWEKRNFNMEAFEILLDKKDLKDFDNTYSQIEKQNFKNCYVVIKLPVGNISAIHRLEDNGYRFLETQLYLTDYFEPIESELELSNHYRTTEIEYIAIPKERTEWEKIIQMITPGMFDTDRISLDPELGKEIACTRYQNWCRDLFNKPETVMYISKYNNEECGFGIDSIDTKTGQNDSILGGFFANYKNMGLGSTWIKKSINLKTAVSSNNLIALKIHQHCGRIVYKERYVLRKIYK